VYLCAVSSPQKAEAGSNYVHLINTAQRFGFYSLLVEFQRLGSGSGVVVLRRPLERPRVASDALARGRALREGSEWSKIFWEP